MDTFNKIRLPAGGRAGALVLVSCDRRDQRPPHPFSGGVDAAEAATGAERMRVSAMIK